MDDDSRPPSVAGSEPSLGGGAAQHQQLRDEAARLNRDLEASKKALASLQDDLKQAHKRAGDQQKEAAKQLDDMRATLEKTR